MSIWWRETIKELEKWAESGLISFSKSDTVDYTVAAVLRTVRLISTENKS